MMLKNALSVCIYTNYIYTHLIKMLLIIMTMSTTWVKIHYSLVSSEVGVASVTKLGTLDSYS